MAIMAKGAVVGIMGQWSGVVIIMAIVGIVSDGRVMGFGGVMRVVMNHVVLRGDGVSMPMAKQTGLGRCHHRAES